MKKRELMLGDGSKGKIKRPGLSFSLSSLFENGDYRKTPQGPATTTRRTVGSKMLPSQEMTKVAATDKSGGMSPFGRAGARPGYRLMAMGAFTPGATGASVPWYQKFFQQQQRQPSLFDPLYQ